MYLKDESHYSRLYDESTVGRCRRIEDHFKESISKYKSKTIGREQLAAEQLAARMLIYFESGGEYLEKERTIQEWMGKDKDRDKLLESVPEPKNATCSGCGGTLRITGKDFYHNSEEKPRILFFMDCAVCHKGTGIFDNGEEYKSKSAICPKCNWEMRHESKIARNIVKFGDNCTHCGFKTKDELDLTVRKTSKREEEEFERDRKRFCLSKEEGERFRSDQVAFNSIKYLTDQWEREDKNKDLYDKVRKLKKLPISEIEKLLSTALARKGYTKLVLSPPDFQKQVVVGFTVQDSLGRLEYDSRNDLRKLIGGTLEETNWRLMSEGITYRLGYLSGRIKGHEGEDQLLEIAASGN